MNEMIERGASVLRKTEDAWLLREDDAHNGLAEENSEPLYHAMARALIEAMRVPTDAMKVDSEGNNCWEWNCQTCGGPKENWERMIDAALGGK